VSPPRPGDPRAPRLLERYLAAFGGTRAPVPVPVEDIAEDLLGLRVRLTPGLPASGMLVPAERVVHVNPDEPPDRRRFTVAHEVAHWVVHCAEQRARPVILCRHADMDGATDPREREANVFAADLLMPEQAVRAAAAAAGPGPAGPDHLAGLFGVSVPAMAWRLYNLELGPPPGS
jgi:Zn-dependent peptidase ImmA (M78 family)